MRKGFWLTSLWLLLAGGSAFVSPPVAAVESSDVALIVNQKNSTQDISSSALRKYFMAERTQWPDGTRVVIAMRAPAGQAERSVVLRSIYNWNEDYYRTYFRQGQFNESIQSVPKELNTTYAMIQYVHYTPGALGYVRADQVDYSKVNVLSVDGRKPGDAGYRLK